MSSAPAAPATSETTSALARCPVCGASSSGPSASAIRRHTDARSGIEFTLSACASCALQYWAPLVHPDAEYYEDEAHAMYAAMHGGARDGSKDPRFRRFLQDFGDARGKRLLDVGCSDGAFMRLFADLGNEVEGIDIDRRSIAVARGHGLDVRVRTLEEHAADPTTRRALDFVTLFDVLEHVTDPVGLLTLARDLLAPGGRLVATVPNRERVVANLIHSDFPPHHFLRFDRASLGRCLQRVGMRVEGVDVFQYGYVGPTLLAEARRVVRSVSGATRSTRAKHSNGASAGASAPGRPRIKQRLTAGIEATLAAMSTPLERALGRGFKLYVVATRG